MHGESQKDSLEKDVSDLAGGKGCLCLSKYSYF